MANSKFLKLRESANSLQVPSNNFFIAKGMVVETDEVTAQRIVNKFSNMVEYSTDAPTHTYNGAEVKAVGAAPAKPKQ